MGKAENRKSRSDMGGKGSRLSVVYSVESGQLFAAAGESKGIGEGVGG